MFSVSGHLHFMNGKLLLITYIKINIVTNRLVTNITNQPVIKVPMRYVGHQINRMCAKLAPWTQCLLCIPQTNAIKKNTEAL